MCIDTNRCVLDRVFRAERELSDSNRRYSCRDERETSCSTVSTRISAADPDRVDRDHALVEEIISIGVEENSLTGATEYPAICREKSDDDR